MMPAAGAALLTNIQNADGMNLFTAGQTLSFTTKKGGRALDPLTLPVTGSTLTNLAAMMDNAIGIHSGGTIPDDPNKMGQPGVDINAGRIRVVGNTGTVNDIAVSVGDLSSNGVSIPLYVYKIAVGHWQKCDHRLCDFRLSGTAGDDQVNQRARIQDDKLHHVSILHRKRR